MEFAVADIEDITWSSSPFECLTIPDEQKEVIVALAETRLGLVPSVPFDDFVAGKGRGLNVLLQYDRQNYSSLNRLTCLLVGPQASERP